MDVTPLPQAEEQNHPAQSEDHPSKKPQLESEESDVDTTSAVLDGPPASLDDVWTSRDVFAITDRRQRDGFCEYLVLWNGDNQHERSWIKRSVLIGKGLAGDLTIIDDWKMADGGPSFDQFLSKQPKLTEGLADAMRLAMAKLENAQWHTDATAASYNTVGAIEWTTFTEYVAAANQSAKDRGAHELSMGTFTDNRLAGDTRTGSQIDGLDLPDGVYLGIATKRIHSQAFVLSVNERTKSVLDRIRKDMTLPKFASMWDVRCFTCLQKIQLQH